MTIHTLPQTPSFQLHGRRALVTGASSGIGLGCAVALAEAGAQVTLAARRLEALQKVVKALQAAGHQAKALAMDITQREQTEALLQQQAPFQVLVNSAGLARHGPALETQSADFDAVMDVNLRSAYFLSTNIAKRLVSEGQNGSLIHISSQMAHVGGIDRAVYCASKHAIEGMIKAMAIEWGQHNIRINSICPTFIRTALTAPTFADPERLAWIQSKIKLPRIGEVEDIMGAAVFLASDAAAMITGTSLLIDGGWTAG